jgi:hypothetical protein
MTGETEFAMLCLGLVVGLFMGYQLNVEKSAGFMAVQICNVTASNLNTMIQNYDLIATQCGAFKLPQYNNVSILPNVINQTVKVYEP